MIDCDGSLTNRYASLQALEAVAMFGTPGLLAVFLARKSIAFQLIWHVPFTIWTLYTFEIYIRPGLTIDGHNGCEYCDFSMIAMLAVGLLGLIPAGFIAVMKEGTGSGRSLPPRRGTKLPVRMARSISSWLSPAD